MAGAGPEFSMREAGPLEVAVIGALHAERFAVTTRRPAYDRRPAYYRRPAAALVFARQLTGQSNRRFAFWVSERTGARIPSEKTGTGPLLVTAARVSLNSHVRCGVS